MDRIDASSNALELSLRRLASAVDSLELAAERRLRHEDARASVEDEFALMQDDRSRLAVELDSALDRSRALEAANFEAGERLARAALAIAQILERMEPAAG
jgi:hypothetical protein